MADRDEMTIAVKTDDAFGDLMRAALAGDGGAYRRLLEAITPRLRAIATRSLSRAGIGAGEAEDVVQETLLAVHLKRHTWDPREPFAPWVGAIARNKAIDAMRRRGRRIELAVDDFAEVLPAPEARDPTEGRDVERLLGRLGDRQRDIVRSVSVEDRSIRETAERLSMSEGAVRVALHRGLKALADLYRRTEP